MKLNRSGLASVVATPLYRLSAFNHCRARVVEIVPPMKSRSIRLFSVLILIGLAAAPAAATGYDPGVCAGYTPDSGDISADCLAMMQAFPAPVVVPISADSLTLSSYSYWRLGPEVVNLYDAPGGNIVGQEPAGFNFAVAIDTSVDGWVQIE